MSFFFFFSHIITIILIIISIITFFKNGHWDVNTRAHPTLDPPRIHAVFLKLA